MVDNYKNMTIREVMKLLPLDEMTDALKAKGLTNEEIKMLLEMEKRDLLREAKSQEKGRCR